MRLQYGSAVQGYTATATSGGTLTLTNTSTQIQNLTGSTTHTVVLPSATTMSNGQWFEIYNSSTGAVTVNKNGGTNITILAPSSSLVIKLSDNSTAAGVWITQASSSGGVSAWQTGYGYIAGNLVLYNKYIYLCITNHTSSATIEPDIESGYWTITNKPQVSKNYVLLGNTFEDNDTGGWQLFTISGYTAGTVPTTAPTIGSAASMTLATTATNPLSDKYSLQISNVASTNLTAGQGIISPLFKIDRMDQAKVLMNKFAYEATTGAGFQNYSGSSSNTWSVLIADYTGGSFVSYIQPAGCYNLVQSVGVGPHRSTWQTPFTMTQFRIVLLCTNTTTGSSPAVNTIQTTFDEFFTGSEVSSLGPAKSDWVAYTPTITNLGTGSATATGLWRRDGDSIELQIRIVKDASGGSGSSSVAASLPAGLAIDYTNKITTNTAQVALGTWSSYGIKGSNTNQEGTVWSSGNTIIFSNPGDASGNALFGSNINANSYLSTNNTKVPIVGWSSNTVQSSDTDTRIISFSGTKGSTQALTANTTDITFTSATDRAGAWTGSTYPVPVAGDYVVSSLLADNGATSGTVSAYVNGVSTRSILFINAGNTGSGSAILPNLKSGDIISLRSNQTTTLAALGNISIHRLSGPAVVQATESVTGRWYSGTAQAITTGSNNTLTTLTQDYDSHSAMNLTTGVYTVPISGRYRISTQQLSASTAWTSGSNKYVRAIVTGSKSFNLFMHPIWASLSQYLSAGGSGESYYLAGQTISVNIDNASGSTYTLATGNNDNWITISRIGN